MKRTARWAMLYRPYKFLLFLALSVALTVSPALAKGSSVQVNLSITDSDGKARTCEGETIYALPVTSKSTKSVERIYGRTDSGFASIYATPELIMRRLNIKHVGGSSPDATRLFRRKFKGQKRGKCNADNIAMVTGLKPGRYYLILPVFWEQEGVAKRRKDINLRGGGRNDIVVKIPTNFRGGTYMSVVELRKDDAVGFDLVNEMIDTTPEGL